MMKRSAELALALKMADEARALALAGFRNSRLVKNKSADGFDPTTDRDIAIEKMMQAEIQAAFPDHQIRGEELPPINPNAQTCWVLDPIDGTRNYYSGSLFWGILIALLEGKQPQLGIIDHPPTQERFVATKDEGMWICGAQTKPLKSKSTAKLRDATLGATTPQMFNADELGKFNAISAQCAVTLYGGNCYFYGLLALGQIDCVIEASLEEYDIAALIPIVRASGGVISDWQGGDPLSGRGQIVASANPELHEQLLRQLND